MPFSVDELEFESMPEPASEAAADAAQPTGRRKGLTIDEAKKGLAATFGVKPDAVEITIRG